MKRSLPLNFGFRASNLPKDSSFLVCDEVSKQVYILNSDYSKIKLNTAEINIEQLKNQLKAYADSKIISVITFKGIKSSIDDLPENKEIGDLYIIGQKEYVWQGSKWEELGSVFDTSQFAFKSEVLSGLALKANSSDVYTKAEVDSALSDKVNKEEGKSLIADTEITRLASVDNYDDSQIRNLISGKVDSVEGKSLSTNDYTTEQKEKLASLSNYDDTVLSSNIITAKDEAIASAKVTSLQIDGSNALNKVLVISEKTTEPAGPKDTQKHKMTIEANPVGYGIFSFNFTDSQNNTYLTSLQLGSTSDQIVVKSEADVTYATKTTTLSGYGITDAKIENGTITLGNNTIIPLTSHQDISNKLDLLPSGHANQFASIQDNGMLTYSQKIAGGETLGTLITNDQLKLNVINQLGITSDFYIQVGADHSSMMSNEYIYDSIHIASYGDQNGLSLYYDQGEWKKTQVIFFANDLYDTFIYKKGQEELSAQLIVDELPTDGSLKKAGINFQTNDVIGTASATIKIKTLSDNVIHEFVVGRVYDTNTLATETAVASIKNNLESSIPTKLSQFTNDVPYLTQTCLPFPDELLDYAQPGDTSTTLAFCQAFENLGLAVKGRIYLGQISNFSDMPFPGNAECMITVCEDGVFTLEMFSTTTQVYHWTATYPGTVGTLTCPWKGNLTCPVTTIADAPVYTPTNEYDGVTKKYVDTAISSATSGKLLASSIPTNVSVFTNDANYITSSYVTAQNTTYQNTTVKAILDQVQTQLSSKLDMESDPVFVSMSGEFVTKAELSTLISSMLSGTFAKINENFETISATFANMGTTITLNSNIQPAPELDYPSLDDLIQ